MKKIFLFIVAATMLISCGNNSGNDEKSTENKTENGSTSGKGTISFKVDGDQVNSEGWVVQRFVWDDETPGVWINITSSMHKDKRTINVNLKGGSPGKYTFIEGAIMESSHGSYFPDFSSPMVNYSFESGEFNITEVDTVNNVLSGTFFGTVKSIQGTTLNISDGKLVNVKMTPGIVNLGKVMDEFDKQ